MARKLTERSSIKPVFKEIHIKTVVSAYYVLRYSNEQHINVY